MISFACNTCSKQLKAKDELAGKKGKCPHCGQSMAVPVVTGITRRHVSPSDHMARKTTRRKALSQSEHESLSGDQDQTALDAGVQERRAPSLPAETSGEPLWDFLAPAEKPDEIGRLGPYRVLKVLGAGGMGVVFRAEDPQLERLVALKAILPSKASHPNAKKRFFREAKVVAALKHPHIVTIHQIGEDRGAPYLAMEFLEGESLEDRLRSEAKFPVSEILRIGQEIAEGLAAAHAKGLIHRDVKPANLWLEGKDERVKILDFGLACVLGDETHLTQSGTVVGTPAYMAPEQARGKQVDSRCDLFSLGCVLYYMCTGERPFKGNDTISILTALALKNPPPPESLNAKLSPELSDIVMHLLEKKPKDRPESARVVAERLRTIEGDISETTSTRGRRTRESRGGSRKRETRRKQTSGSMSRNLLLAGLAAGGLVGLGVVLLLVFLLTQASDNPAGPQVKLPDGHANEVQKPAEAQKPPKDSAPPQKPKVDDPAKPQDRKPPAKDFTAKQFTKPPLTDKPLSYMRMESTSGDYIGQGRVYDYAGERIKPKLIGQEGLRINVDDWTLEVAAPKGQMLQPGEYLGARRNGFNSDVPGLNLSGRGRGSNRVGGEFVVWELETDNGQVTRLALDFVQRSEETGPPLRGRVRINSNYGPPPGPTSKPEPVVATQFAKPPMSDVPVSWMRVESSPGEFVGQGKTYEYKGDRLVAKTINGGVAVTVDGWTFEIAAPRGQLLRPGEYLDVKRTGFHGDAPGLGFSGNGRGPNNVFGKFVVWDLEVVNDNVVRLAVDFVQHSREKGPPLTGSIRINTLYGPAGPNVTKKQPG